MKSSPQSHFRWERRVKISRKTRIRFPAALAMLAATGAAASGGGAPIATAASPGQNGKLAFFFTGEVWVANPDGSGATQLTASPGADRAPSWSPDGTRIAFASERAGLSEIFVMNADGSDQRRITFNGARDRTNAWSGDGTRVVYDKEFAEIYLANADGSGGEVKLADGLLPAMSAYGTRVAFAATAGGLVTMNLDGTERREVTLPEFADWSPDWSPGGTDLVFTRATAADRDLYRVHSNGIGLVRLTNTPDRSEVGPVWSPDGTKIAFLGCPNPLTSFPNCAIFTMNRDASGEARVPGLTVSFAEGGLDWQPLPPFPRGNDPPTLTVDVVGRAGSGSVTSDPAALECPPACSAEFDRGSTVRLEARPTGGAAFLRWNGACSGRSGSCSVLLDGEKRVGAVFGPASLRLTVAVRGPGRVVSAPAGIACPRRCAATFANGARVRLRAVPARGATFVGWSSCTRRGDCRVAMTANRVVRARFRR